MANIRDFVPTLTAYVEGAPTNLMVQRLMDSAIRFYEDTGIKQTGIQLTTTPSIGRYTLTLPDGYSIIRVESVETMNPMTDKELSYLFGQDWLVKTGTPVAFNTTPEGDLRIVPTPTEVGSYLVVATVKPSRLSQVVDDFILEDYEEAIVSGALTSLYAMPNKPWENKSDVRYHQGLYRRGVTTAKARISKSRTKNPSYVQVGGLMNSRGFK